MKNFLIHRWVKESLIPCLDSVCFVFHRNFLLGGMESKIYETLLGGMNESLVPGGVKETQHSFGQRKPSHRNESQNGAFANAKQMKHCLDEKCNPSSSKIPISNMPLKKKNETYQLMKNLILSKFKMESVIFITPFLQRLTCIQGKPRRLLNCCLSWKSWEISPSGKLLSYNLI